MGNQDGLCGQRVAVRGLEEVKGGVAHRYAIFLCSLDIEILPNQTQKIYVVRRLNTGRDFKSRIGLQTKVKRTDIFHENVGI